MFRFSDLKTQQFLVYSVLFFFKQKGFLNKNNQVNLLFYQDSRSQSFARGIVRKLYFYQKYLIYFLLKELMQGLHKYQQFLTARFSFYLPTVVLDTVIPPFLQSKSAINKNVFGFFSSINTIVNRFDFVNKYFHFFIGLFFMRCLLLSYYSINAKASSIFCIKRKSYTVLRSPFKYKKAREQFEYSIYKMLIKHSSNFSMLDTNYAYRLLLNNFLERVKLEEEVYWLN